MAVDASAESCLQTEAHSRVSSVSDWRECARLSRLECDSAELESEKEVVAAAAVGLRARVRKRLAVSCSGGASEGTS